MTNLLLFFIFVFFLSAPLTVHAQITVLPKDQCPCPADYYSREPFCPGLCVPVGSHPSSNSQCQAVGIPADGCREQETCILAAPGGKPECINNDRLKQVQLQPCQGNARLSEVGKVGDEHSCPVEADCFTSTGAGGVICQKYIDCQLSPSIKDCPSTITDQTNIIRCGTNNSGMVCSSRDASFCSQSGTTICAKDQSAGECKRFCANGQEALSPQGSWVCSDRSNPTISATQSCPAGFKPNPGANVNNCTCVPTNPVNPGGNSGINCAADSEKCSSSAGQLCDPTLNPDNFWTTDKDGNRIPKPGNGVMTAIGCVPTEPQALINALIKVAAGVSGAIALLLMIAGSIQMLISGGTSEEIKKGRDQFIAAGVGLLFIILSVTLLQILGVDILNIPGFGK